MSVIYFQNKYFLKAKNGADFKNDFDFPHERGVAFQCENFFVAVSIMHGGQPEIFKIEGPEKVSLKDWVSKSFGDPNPIESDYQSGTVYKRIFKPVAHGNYFRAINEEKLTQSFISLRILLNKLEELFETIEPSKENLTTYGYKVREILLLACMEVESAWTAVLKENGYSIAMDKLNTNDYIKLKDVMLLDTYSLNLQHYSNFPNITPFKDWIISDPTKSLSWYSAYNKTKHDREENLKFASLENAVTAVGAAVVMFHAQFGFYFGAGFTDKKSPVIQNVFRLTSSSSSEENLKKNESDYYIAKFELPENATPTTNPQPSFDWKLIDYKF